MSNGSNLYGCLLGESRSSESRIYALELWLAQNLFSYSSDELDKLYLAVVKEAVSSALEHFAKGDWNTVFSKPHLDDLAAELGRVSQALSSPDSIGQAELWDHGLVLGFAKLSLRRAELRSEAIRDEIELVRHTQFESQGKELNESFSFIKDGFEAEGIERSEFFRLAKHSLQEIYASPEGSQSGIVQFMHGIILAMTSQYGGEATQVMKRARIAGFGSTVGLHNLILWVTARLHLLQEEKLEALASMTGIKELEGDFFMWLDLAKLQLEFGNRDAAYKAVQKAIDLSPLTYLFILAEKKFAQLGPVIEKEFVRASAGWKLQNRAVRTKLDKWIETLARSEKISGFNFTSGLFWKHRVEQAPPGETDDCVLKQFRLQLSCLRALESSQEDSRVFVEEKLEELAEQKASIKQAILKGQTNQEAKINLAKKRQMRKLAGINQELKQVDFESKRAEKGCIWSAEYGLIMFGIYILAVAVFAFLGNPTVYRSPASIGIGVLIAVPIAMAVILQFATIFRRVQVEALAKMLRNRAEVEFNQEVKEIEKEALIAANQSNKELQETEANIERLSQVQNLFRQEMATKGKAA